MTMAAPAGGLPGWGMAVLLWAFALGYWDLRHRRLPNALTFAAALAGLGSWAILGASPLGASGMSMLAGSGIALLLTVPGYLLHKLGAGDVKLLVAVALLGGVAATLVSFVVGALIAGIGAGARALLGSRFGLPPVAAGRQLPFGTALALGFAVAVLGGHVGDLP